MPDAAGLEEAVPCMWWMRWDPARSWRSSTFWVQRKKFSASCCFDFGEGEVGGVGLGGEGVAAAHGIETPDEGGVGVPGFGGSDVFDAMTIPETSGAAEGGETRFGGDAGAGEDEEVVFILKRAF